MAEEDFKVFETEDMFKERKKIRKKSKRIPNSRSLKEDNEEVKRLIMKRRGDCVGISKERRWDFNQGK